MPPPDSSKDGSDEKLAKRASAKARRLEELEGAPEGTTYCHCKAQAPPPPPGGASAWICYKNDAAANGDFKEELDSGAINYSMSWISMLPGRGLNFVRMFLEYSEDIKGSEVGYAGFLLVYELFTSTKEIVFRGKSTSQQNHTFATLLMRFISGVDEKGVMQSILHTLARNPWVCSIMPKWSDTRSDSWNSFMLYGGWKDVKSAADFLGSDEDPISRLLFNAQETLQQLKEKGYLLEDSLPTCGFVPPVVLPEGNLLVDAVGGDSPERSAAQPPHSGQKTASGSMQKPASLIRLTLRKCPSASAPKGEVLRWHGGLKGLQERSYEACTTQTDYRKSALTLEAVGDVPLGELLGAPLGKLNDGVLTREPQQRSGSSSLPFGSIVQHPEAQSVNATSSLSRLADDYATFFRRPLQKVSLEGLSVSGVVGASQLIRAEEALLQLRARLHACGAEDRAFVASASAELMQTANELGLAGRPTSPSSSSVLRRLPAGAAITEAKGDSAARFRFALLRHSGHESPLWFEYLVGCLLSSYSQSDLQKLNPFVSGERCDELMIVLANMLLRSNRVVQANAASEACGSAIDQIRKMRVSLAEGSLTAAASLELQLKLDALCTLIMTTRAYGKDATLERAEEAQASDEYLSRLRSEAVSFAGAEKETVDPRFMAFEFLWSLQLRPRQVDLVRRVGLEPQWPQPEPSHSLRHAESPMPQVRMALAD